MNLTDFIAGIAAELHDPDHARFPKEDLAEFVTDGLRQIAAVRPDEFARPVVIECVEGPRQVVPGVRFVEVSANVTNSDMQESGITRADVRTLDRFDPGWRQRTGGVVEEYAYDDRRPREFLVIPPVPAGHKLEVVQVSEPDVVEAPEGDDWPSIDLPSTYAPTLRQWVLYRAHGRQTAVEDNDKAQRMYQAFFTGLGQKVPGAHALDPRREDRPRKGDD